MNLLELLANIPEILSLDALSQSSETIVRGVTADSRVVEPGFVFVGLRGVKADGASFLAQVFEKGAIAAVIGQDSEIPSGVDVKAFPVIRVSDPHMVLAQLAARFHGAKMDLIAAVTGTNGKTSIASFLRQIWQFGGYQSASIGTIGVEGPKGRVYGSLTTPDPVSLMRDVQKLAGDGVTHLAVEASSHGLEQKRLDCLDVSVGAFTNLTRDHLDYHGTFEAYRDAKAQLFSRLVRVGGKAIINLDDPLGNHFLDVARDRGLECFTLAENGEADLKIENIVVDGFQQHVTLSGVWGRCECLVPLIGTFQASNALVAGLMAYAGGMEPDVILEAISRLKGARGRMELVGHKGPESAIFVDFSHTPDSLETALKALRPFTKGRLIVVFGAGGDRDRGKRPMMGQAASAYADYSIVTDDNPRSEDPASIRKAIMEAVDNGIEIGGRGDAISAGVDMMHADDVLLVAGKGHEEGQIVKGEVLHFSDHEAIVKALEEYNGKGAD